MTESLFRPEAIAAQKDTWLGHTVLLRPLGVSITAALGVIIVLAITAYLIFGEYTRRVRLTGVVTPSAGIARVFAPSAGRVVSLNIADGNEVRQGQSLYTITSDSMTSLGETQAAAAALLRKQRSELEAEIIRQQKLDGVEKAGLTKEEQGLLREIDQVQAQIKVTGDYAAVLKTISEKYEELVRRHVVLQREAFARMESRMQKEQELENLRREAIRLEQRLTEVRTKLAGFDAKAASVIGHLRRQISVIERDLVEGEARRQIDVTTPRTGSVTAILVQSGQFVAAGTPLLSILPSEAQLEVHLYGSSSVIGFMHENAKVMLRYAAFPYQKFGLHPGTVAGFSRVSLRPSDIDTISLPERGTSPTSDPSAGLYRVVVRPEQDHVIAYGKAEPIRPGMAVDADVFLDTRPIYEWLLEPLYSLRGTLSNQGDR
ncbi:HlyD family secretion protein [Mesorhizobium sp. NPDC059025]|uniref:HlyD family secretion protein n=1 Tax=Mesorhizobium sp. NPDC059025 TaxID=3346708 RepID=UPI003671F426